MKKILVVDDFVEMLELLVSMLEQENYDVYAASSGSEALEIAKKVKFDLVISDLQMPIMSGIEFGHKFREICSETQIIFFSSQIDASVQYKLDFEMIKNNFFIEKDYVHLLESVRRYFNGKELQ